MVTGAVQTWTLTPAHPPAVVRPCPRCHAARPFQSSGRFRLNANGSRLDAWLIYRCACCEATWNLPVAERQRPDALGAARVAAYETSCPDAVASVAYQRDLLARYGRVVDDDEVAVSGVSRTGASVDVVIANPLGVSWRLERVIGCALQLSRSAVRAAVRRGAVAVHDRGRLARPVRDGQRLSVYPDESLPD